HSERPRAPADDDRQIRALAGPAPHHRQHAVADGPDRARPVALELLGDRLVAHGLVLEVRRAGQPLRVQDQEVVRRELILPAEQRLAAGALALERPRGAKRRAVPRTEGDPLEIASEAQTAVEAEA